MGPLFINKTYDAPVGSIPYSSKITKSNLADLNKVQNELNSVKNQPNSLLVQLDDDTLVTMTDYRTFLSNVASGVSPYESEIVNNPNIRLDNAPNDEETDQDISQQETASIQAQITEIETSLEEIDTFILELLSGKPIRDFKVVGSNNKFIKVADEHENNKKEVRKYFNDLYEETPGSPDYGDEMTEDYTVATPRFRIIKK
jgi:predicted HAD superfamily phosphohydrolase